MALTPTTFRFPFAIQDQPHEVQQAHIFAFNAVLDLQNAIKSLKGQIDGKTTITNTITSVGGGGGEASLPRSPSLALVGSTIKLARPPTPSPRRIMESSPHPERRIAGCGYLEFGPSPLLIFCYRRIMEREL